MFYCFYTWCRVQCTLYQAHYTGMQYVDGRECVCVCSARAQAPWDESLAPNTIINYVTLYSYYVFNLIFFNVRTMRRSREHTISLFSLSFYNAATNNNEFCVSLARKTERIIRLNKETMRIIFQNIRAAYIKSNEYFAAITLIVIKRE